MQSICFMYNPYIEYIYIIKYPLIANNIYCTCLLLYIVYIINIDMCFYILYRTHYRQIHC